MLPGHYLVSAASMAGVATNTALSRPTGRTIVQIHLRKMYALDRLYNPQRMAGIARDEVWPPQNVIRKCLVAQVDQNSAAADSFACLHVGELVTHQPGAR
jgi:hypothetical protein